MQSRNDPRQVAHTHTHLCLCHHTGQRVAKKQSIGLFLTADKVLVDLRQQSTTLVRYI